MSIKKSKVQERTKKQNLYDMKYMKRTWTTQEANQTERNL
jgi:hypothetical protein